MGVYGFPRGIDLEDGNRRLQNQYPPLSCPFPHPRRPTEAASSSDVVLPGYNPSTWEVFTYSLSDGANIHPHDTSDIRNHSNFTCLGQFCREQEQQLKLKLEAGRIMSGCITRQQDNCGQVEGIQIRSHEAGLPRRCMWHQCIFPALVNEVFPSQEFLIHSQIFSLSLVQVHFSGP